MVRAVIADDEYLVAMALHRAVESCGYEVVGRAATGARAVDQCRVHRPDVVFMDLHMPGKDGLEATREIMNTCPTCVIVVTGNRESCALATEAGAMDYAAKPLGAGQIPSLVDAALARFRRFMAAQRVP
jgi:AmiR/NasT family two-component response regulator